MQLAVRNYNRFHVALAPVVAFWELGHDHCQDTEVGAGELAALVQPPESHTPPLPFRFVPKPQQALLSSALL